MKPMADLLRNHQRTTALEKAVWAAKIVFLIIGISSTTVLLAKFAFPYCHSLLSSSLPRLWNSILAWRVRPYLFITVHFIIIVIWKLHGNQRTEDLDKSADAPPLPVSLEHKPSSEISHEIYPSPMIPREIPAAEPFCVDSDKKSSDSSDVDIKKGIEQRPWTPLETEEAKDDESSSSGPDTIDGMWKAIMDGGSEPVRHHLKKSDTWERSSRMAADGRELRKSETFKEAVAAAKKEMRKSATFRESAVGWRGREVLVVGNDELFRRGEAFIKMNYDQMRLQRQDYLRCS